MAIPSIYLWMPGSSLPYGRTSLAGSTIPRAARMHATRAELGPENIIDTYIDALRTILSDRAHLEPQPEKSA